MIRLRRFITKVISELLGTAEGSQAVSRSDLGRQLIADMYLKGDGIEIGALHNPLKVPHSARVRYVDRMSVAELTKQYRELDASKFVDVDIIDDGERLENIKDSSLDFVIANHLLEHCQDPIGAIGNMLRVLKNGGILYLAVPDKRFTFDIDRPTTSIEHLLRDREEGPAWGKRQHFEEWTRLVNKVQNGAEAESQIAHLMDIDYSIHYHVWTQIEFLELIIILKKNLYLGFEMELVLKKEAEVIVVLRNTG